MLKTVTGVYENGLFELAESPQVTGRTPVTVSLPEGRSFEDVR